MAQKLLSVLFVSPAHAPGMDSFYNRISIDCTFLKWKNKIEYRVFDYHIYCYSASHLLRCTTTCYNLSLECGFISLKGGIHYPVDSCTLSLRDNGEGGLTTSDYGFEFTAGKVNHINSKSFRFFKSSIFFKLITHMILFAHRWK